MTMTDSNKNKNSTNNNNLVGLGNPLLDISANVDQALLDKYDITLDNAILADESGKHLPLYKELLAMKDVELVAGGATQNSIRVAQWMLSSNALSTSKCHFFGCIGKSDEYGKLLSTCATKDGVQVHYLEDATAETGTCAVCVKDGERSLVANLAAANNFKIEHLESKESMDVIESANVFYSAGFHLTVCPEAMIKLGQHAAENNKVFCMNLSAPFLMMVFKDPLLKVIPYCDFVFSNETEALEFGKMKEWGDDLNVIALKLSQLPKESGSRCRTVVFTQGSKPTIVAHQGKVTSFDTPVLAEKDIVDSNGAGDAFVGGFLAQFMQDKPLEDSVRAGNWAAQVILKRAGCTFPEECEFK